MLAKGYLLLPELDATLDKFILIFQETKPLGQSFLKYQPFRCLLRSPAVHFSDSSEV
jgi:hypothetical protein